MTALRYAEITPELHAGLRIIAALEACYPQHGNRATRALAGHAEWRKKKAIASRDSSTSTSGVHHG